jgi:hypothetical protein
LRFSWTLVVGALLLAYGFLMIVQTVVRFRRYRAASGWPTAMGQVLSINVARYVGEVGPEMEIRLRYEYEVAGTRHESENIAPGGDVSYALVSPTVTLARSLRRGDAVEVRYDPNNPKHACLRPENVGAVPLLAGLGVVAVSIGALMINWAR